MISSGEDPSICLIKNSQSLPTTLYTLQASRESITHLLFDPNAFTLAQLNCHSSRARIQHLFSDGRSGWTGIYENHKLSAGITVERVPWRRIRDMQSHFLRRDTSFRGIQLDTLGFDIDSLG